MSRFLLPAVVILALAGCARDKTIYPSLGVRPVEKLGFAEPEAPAPAPVAADPALDARIATMTAMLDTLAKGFAGDVARAETATAKARGRPVGSDAWLDAQTALADLDDRRSQTSALVTDVDELAAGRAQALAPDYPSLSALQDKVQAEASAQGEAITRLQALLPGA